MADWRWELERDVTCVVCPDCAFTFDGSHMDEDGGFSCPNCAEARMERQRDALLKVARMALEEFQAGGLSYDHPICEEIRAAIAQCEDQGTPELGFCREEVGSEQCGRYEGHDGPCMTQAQIDQGTASDRPEEPGDGSL